MFWVGLGVGIISGVVLTVGGVFVWMVVTVDQMVYED